ncbi:DUF2867 domain-containing protein [Nocardia sp. NPDC051030]|uniref:DUF2867 domain-containing protein n=1 Tax=Nocardia sp. NPDC051030 TaxID=3155162 RepID=UPI0034450B05
MRLPDTAYTDRPWRIHEIAPDFEVEDVWAMPTPGGPDGLARFVTQFTAGDDVANPIVRSLLTLRFKLGALLGLDKPDSAVGARVPSLRDRLPEDLRSARGPDFASVPFKAVYLTDTEYVAEMANRTVHALMHVGWVQDGNGGYYGQMTSLVKPNGLFGKFYMTAIQPLRRAVVMPALLRSIGKDWRLADA